MVRKLFELWKDWQEIRSRAANVLAMNQRNLNFIYPHNPRRHFPLADDKLLTKELMVKAGVPVPATYASYSSFYELRNLEQELSGYGDFVIKPSKGSGGGGIIVITSRQGSNWIGPSGKRYSITELRKHISDIIFGVYSFDLSDRVIIEERVQQNEEMTQLSPTGLADVRVILFNHHPVLSMTRIPTLASQGRANLHQGAIGIGINMESGTTTHAILNNEPITAHPDTGLALIGRQIPYWSDILRISRLAAEAVPLKYLGVDISISKKGPVLLEINVRPGLQIQNANLTGLRHRLESIRQPRP
ncbi:MAG TPA: sugar-transfer associated ATP-grasp domain-containing protein [Gammaproteobacteria bacterium]